MSTAYVGALLHDYNHPKTLEESTSYTREMSGFEKVLEFNENIILSDLYATRQYYNGLLESGDFVLHEDVLASISGFIANVILYTRNFFAYIFGGSSSEKDSGKNYRKIIKRNVAYLEKKSEEFRDALKHNSIDNKDITITEFNRPNGIDKPSMSIILGNQEAIALLNSYNADSRKLFDAIKAASIDEDQVKETVEKIKQSHASIMKHIEDSHILDRFTGTEKTVNSIEFVSTKLKNISVYEYGKDKVEMSAFPEFKQIIDNMDQFGKMITSDTSKYESFVNYIRSIIVMQAELAKAITSNFNTYNEAMYKSIVKETSELVKILRGLLEDDDDQEEEFEESTALNEAIMAEMTNYRWEKISIYKEAMIQEAVIRGNPQADVVYEMESLNEAIATKAKSAFNKMVAKIKEIFRRFMEKLRANFTTTKHYCDKYKKILLNNKVPYEEYTCKDLLRGMDRVLNYEIPAFNYNEIKDHLGSNMAFFNKIRGTNNNFDTSFRASAEPSEGNDSLAAIGNYFKEYFGMCKENIVIRGSEFQNRMQDIFNFMYDIRKIEKSVNDSIKRVEGMRRDALKQAGVPTTTQATPAEDTSNKTPTATQNATASTTQISQNASYLNMNYMNYFLELQGNNPNQPTQSTNPNSSGTGQTAQNMKNVAANTNTDTAGRIQYGTNGTPLDEVNAKCDVYINVAVKVLEAKLTAIEFLRNEFMQLFRSIVGRYVEGEAETTKQAEKAAPQYNNPTVQQRARQAGKAMRDRVRNRR